MTMFVIQTLLLLAISFVFGCILGALVRHYRSTNVSKIQPVELEKEQVSTVDVKESDIDPEPALESMPLEAEKHSSDNQITEKPAETNEIPSFEGKRDSGDSNQPEASKDNLKLIKGIGPQNEARLNSIGITSFSQIAAWSESEQYEIGEKLAFPGRVEREEWVKQAMILAEGEMPDRESNAPDSKEPLDDKPPAKADEARTPPLLSDVPDAGADNLTLIEGVGNALERKLNNLGVYTYSQIAEWSEEQAAWIGNELGFPGRPERENWVAEAKALVNSGASETSRKVARGEITTKKARL